MIWDFLFKIFGKLLCIFYILGMLNLIVISYKSSKDC